MGPDPITKPVYPRLNSNWLKISLLAGLVARLEQMDGGALHDRAA